MKITIQKIICATLACITLILSACAKTEYKQDVNTIKMAMQLSQKVPTESSWVIENENFLKEYIAIPESVRELQIYYAQNTNSLDEFGIFEVARDQTKEVRKLIEKEYLQKRYEENREWYDSYMPAETPKLRDAEVRVYGNCVVYAILSPEGRTAFFAECEKMLKEQK